MTFKDKFSELVKKPKFILILWILLATFAGVREYFGKGYNNYSIFKHVYYHTLNQQPLFESYPDSYWDVNHYGPFFSVVIAPFAALPDAVGIPLWVIAGALILFFAIKALPIDDTQRVIIYWLITSDLFTAFVNTQFNPIITATIILAYCFIRNEKDFWAAFFIMFGAFVKLYSIAGLAFFFFSKHKTKLLAYSAMWAILFFAIPMIISSSEFIIDSYIDWWNILTVKDSLNAELTSYQDFSVMGIYRRLTHDPTVSSIYFLAPGIFLFFVPYLKISQYKNDFFQMLLLCSVLIFIVIFSSSSEGSTYIIATAGAALWFVLHRPPSKLVIALICAVMLASLSSMLLPSDIYKAWIIGYSLKALPSFLVWCYVIYEMIALREKQT